MELRIEIVKQIAFCPGIATDLVGKHNKGCWYIRGGDLPVWKTRVIFQGDEQRYSEDVAMVTRVLFFFCRFDTIALLTSVLFMLESSLQP